MHYLYVLFILIFCVPAYFAPSHLIRPFAYFATLSLLIGVFGCAWPGVMPKDFLQNNPWAANSPLQPAISMAIGSVCLLFGIGLFLALGSRKLLKKN